MKNLNEYIAVCLKNILTPNSDQKISLLDIIELAPVPQLKLLSCHTNPFIFDGELSCDKGKDWQDIISDGINQITHSSGSPHLIAAKGYSKYKESGAFDVLDDHMTKKIKSKFKCVDWNDNLLSNVLVNESPFYSRKECPFSFTLLSNSTVSVKPLKNILKNGKIKYRSKAYLHWYAKYDVGEEEFNEAFKYVEETVD
jgi:hypothetical protein